MIIKIIIQLFLIGICLAEDFVDRKREIIFSNIIFRHGDRTPLAPYRNDPYKNQSYWPVPFGSLTSIGKDQHRRLGAWLRSRYQDLIDTDYDPLFINATSTQSEVAIESAELTLLGMFPPKHDVINAFVLQTIPTEFDNKLDVRRKCPRYDEELQKVLQSPQIRELDESNKDFYEFLSNHTGENVTSLMDIKYIYDTLLVEKIHNKTWPEWTKIDEKLMDRLTNLYLNRTMLQANTTEMQRFKSGLLIRELTRNMNMRLNFWGHWRKVSIYSVNDDTIVNMLMALGIFEPHIPTYAATVGMELRLVPRTGYFITIFYKPLDEEPVYLKLKECDVMCPWMDFVKVVMPLMIRDWEEDCHLGKF